MTRLMSPECGAVKAEPLQGGYCPFPSIAWRNLLQEFLEVFFLVRSMRLPAGQKILEVGCGRGIALAPL